MTRYLTLLTLLLCSLQAHSKGYLTGLSSGGVLIDRVFVHRSGAVSLLLATPFPYNPDACGTQKHAYFEKTGNPAYEAMLSVALSAHASGKKVGLYGAGCEIIPFWGGTVDRPVISEIWGFNE